MNYKSLLRPSSWVQLSIILAVITLSSACSNPEKAKVEHVRQGDIYLKEKKFQEASIEFRNALQIDDKLATAHWGLAQSYEGLERFNEAIEELNRTIQLDANNLEARVKMGNYLMLVRPPRLDEADRFAEEVLQKDSKNPEGYILKATVLYARDPQKNRDAALAQLNRAVEINPNRIESHLSLSRFFEQIGDASKTEEAIRRAISIDDKSSLAHTTYAGFLVRQNRSDAAEAELKKAVEVDPQNRNARLTLASFYLVNTKQINKAEEAYKALAELDKNKPEGRAVLADFYSIIGRGDEAIKIYQEIVDESPEYVKGRYRLGEIMLQRGDKDGALKQINEILKKNGRDMQARLLHARISLQGGDNLKAIEDLKEVLNQDARDQVALYFMAEANFRAGQLEQSRIFAGDLEKFHPKFLPGKLMQVQINLASGDAQNAQRGATELIQELSKAAPNSLTSPQLLAELQAKALTARGSANLRLNDVKAARADMEAARNIAPKSPGSHVNLAIVSLAEKKIDEAIQNYENALHLDSANFDALNGLINIFAAQGKLDQAHARVDQALNAQPNNALLHFLKANVYGMNEPRVVKTEAQIQESAQRVESSLRRALEIDANYIAAYKALASLYFNLRQPDRAIEQYRKVIERKRDDVMAYTMMGMIEYGRNNHDVAAEHYKQALKIDPNSIIASNNLAMLYAEHAKGNLDEAMKLAQAIVQKNPDEPGYVDTLGWVYHKKGLHAAAIEQLQKAVTKSVARKGDNSLYRYHLGMALAGAGKKADARRELETALRLAENEAKNPGGRTFEYLNEVRHTLTTL